MKRFIFATLIVLVSIFLSCKKNEIQQKITTIVPPVNSSVAGVITDVNNVPISDATIAAGSSTTTTDANGAFILRNVDFNADGGLVNVTKDGFFNGSRTFLVNASSVNNVKIQLIPKTISGSFDASSGGNINMPNGESVNFGGGFVNAASGSSYSGSVSVSSFYLDPADQNFTQYMPGNLTGISAANKQGILRSFGMTVVEMADASGNRLQLASGKTATLILPIPPELAGSAPATISLWYFDDTKGVWKEEGTAARQGKNYVGTVKHFSFWMPGELAQSITLNAKFSFDTSSAIFPLANRQITITSATQGTTSSYTDSSGTVSGLVPANESLGLKVFNACGDSIFGKNIGPFTTDTNLGNITVTGNTCYMPPPVISLTATLNDQNGNPLAGNLVVIANSTFSDSSIITSSSGQFNVSLPSAQTFVMKVYDLCGDSIYSQHIGPFTWVSDLGTVSIQVVSAINIVISGTVVDCNNNAVTGGAVSINIVNGQFSSSIINGNFAITLKRCNGTPAPATVTVYDEATTQNITEQQITVSNTNQNIGQMAIPCGNYFSATDSSRITLSLGDSSYLWAAPNDSLGAQRIDSGSYSNTEVYGGFTGALAPTPLKYISLLITNDNASPATYSLTVYINVNDTIYRATVSTIVTEYGPVGRYVSGTASGQALDGTTGTSIPFSCNYRVRRTE